MSSHIFSWPRFKHSLSIRGSDSFGDHVSSQIHPFSKKSFKALTSKFLKFALKIMTNRVGLLSKVGCRRNRWVGLGWGGFLSCSGRSSLPCFLLPGQLLQVLADTKPCCFSCCCGGNGRCDGCHCCWSLVRGYPLPWFSVSGQRAVCGIYKHTRACCKRGESVTHSHALSALLILPPPWQTLVGKHESYIIRLRSL